MIPGIDLAGVVESSTTSAWKPGDQVILNGWGIGESHLGAFAEKSRVKGDWLVRLPAGMSPRDAMAIGTAGYTAMLAVMALERHGLRPEQGPVIVTGAAGGVGSVAVAVLAGRRLPGHRLDRPRGRSALPQGPRGGRSHRPRRSDRCGSSACPGALGRRYRFGRLDHPRQRAVDDQIRRCGGGMWAGRRHGPADQRRAVHFARSVASRHRFCAPVHQSCASRHGSAWLLNSIAANWQP